MFNRILPADINNESDAGTQRCNVSKILLWTNADVYTIRLNAGLQYRNDFLVADFIRDEILGVEIPIPLRKVGNHFPVFLVADFRRQGLWYSEGFRPDKQQRQQGNAGRRSET